MGRSTTSCFKIISCGGSNESVDRDDIDFSSENKGSDKRGWSFRKRSASHRVLSNTVVTEKPSSENKKGSEPAAINSEAHINSNISEKTSDNIWTEEIPQLSSSTTKDATVSTIVPEAALEDDIKCESVPDESAILVIQSAVRRFLAQRQLVRNKNVVKLQAAVRGHLVRSHAVGTLRCVQAIVKMQAIVRARRANLSVGYEEKGVQNPTYISVEKLLSNSLARQLLETTPKTKQINIKCDPSKYDSAWNWLERWMSVSSPDVVQSHVSEQVQDNVNNNTEEHQIGTVIPPHCEPKDTESNVEEETTMPSEEKENLINTEQNPHENEKPQPVNTYIPEDEPMHLDAEVQIEVNSVPEKPELPKRAAKRVATDQADNEGRKSVFGSRKASNPAFIAAQSRFEELTSKNNNVLKSLDFSNQENEADNGSFDPLKSLESSNQDNDAPSSADTTSSALEDTTPVISVEPEDHLVSRISMVVSNGGSECGTELSITSTLDSPDQPEVGNKKIEEAKVVDETVDDMNNNNNDNIDVEHVFPSGDKTSDLVTPEKHESNDKPEERESNDKPEKNENLKSANTVAEEKLDESASDTDIELELESGHHVYKSNAQASPISHTTVPESQGTPSSQVSTSTKKSKSDKKGSSQKRKSWSTSKKSQSSGGDSGLRSSMEKLPKDTKPGKRRNSFGSSPKPDHVDQEANGNSSVPSYMQATESARLKAIANSSPRSSPDVQDKDVYLKKRHSLPGAVNGRQGSPRIQRSMSQAMETAKGNGNQERKWQR